ncbi:hypothetical protein QJS04_geneDACA023112 [Acorus gramineus]|uniref:Neprosin PEP catalytic domain-containing protein n=1 Tax=Acorus gramineus TaxID=55184 RepID=A0AAV9A1U9_ACOGR|nr:hypothetical protein QJS04_geneDACA023112 [Acorus gramineus]
MLCPGFVQVSKQITVGSTLEPLSTYKGTQYYAVVLVFRDPKNGNWWMSFGDGPGYWPSELFKSLATKAGKVAWGGLVFSPTNEPSPPMGNGHRPFEEGDTDLNACHFKKLKLVNDKIQAI